MSKREVLALILILLAYLVSVVDQFTPLGDWIWERTIGGPDRYVVTQDSRIGYINGRGRLVIPPIYDSGPRYFSDEYVPVSFDEQFGFINNNGDHVIPFKFAWARPFSEGYAVVGEPREGYFMYGFINEDGQYTSEQRFFAARDYSEGLAAVKTNTGEWGFIDKKGEFAIAPRYENVKSFSEGMAAIKHDGKWGYMNLIGHWVIKPQYDMVESFSEGLAAVRHEGRWGFINTNGAYVIDPQYVWVHNFADGLAAFSSSISMGYIDGQGQVQIDNSEFSDVKDFVNGLAPVRITSFSEEQDKSRWGYINKLGEVVIPNKFEWAMPFEGDLARVGMDKDDPERAYLNAKGRLIWDPAEWERDIYLRQLIVHTSLFVLAMYIFFLYRSYLSRRRRSKVFYEVAKERNGICLPGGLLGEVKLALECKGHRLIIYHTDNLFGDFDVAVNVETTLPADLKLPERHFSFTMDSMKEDRSIPSDLLTEEMLDQIIEAGFDRFHFVVHLTKRKFVLNFHGDISSQEEYSFLIDLAYHFFSRLTQMNFNQKMAL